MDEAFVEELLTAVRDTFRTVPLDSAQERLLRSGQAPSEVEVAFVESVVEALERRLRMREAPQPTMRRFLN